MAKLQVEIYKKIDDFVLDVSFEAEDEIMALLGASGCGKSMTLKCIAGIEKPDRGRIVLDHKVLFDSNKKINIPPQERKIGYMFQDYALFNHMTVLDNIAIAVPRERKSCRNAFIRKEKSYKYKKAKELIDTFQLKGLENHYPNQLSGGQKQRVAMARMLAAKPSVLLLDEPFCALDSYLKWELEQEMKETLEKINSTVLFVSHNRDEVYRICKTVTCINQGRMEEKSTIKNFFKNPGTRTAAILSGCKNVSKVKIIDKRHIWAEEWQQDIFLKKEIEASCSYIGIRAHSLIPLMHNKENSVDEIILTAGERKILEDPFEWNVSFRKDNSAKWIQWKVAKGQWSPESIPLAFEVREEDILFLSE